jgi:hypothetical protein
MEKGPLFDRIIAGTDVDQELFAKKLKKKNSGSSARRDGRS